MTELRKVTVNKVSFGYSGRPRIFRNLSAKFASDEFSRGTCIAVMGPSGCGKTTLLKLLMGMATPQEGEILRSPDQGYCSLLTQDPLLFEHYTRTRNARYFETLEATKKRFDGDQYQRMVALLSMENVLGRSGNLEEMSGGERQRLSLVRALSVRPEFLMLDEPCTGMDRPVKSSFLIALRELIEEQGIVAFYATHHLEEAKLVADQLVFLEPCTNAGEVRCHVDSLQKLLATPPNLEVAQFLAEESLNTFDVVLREGVWCTVRGGHVLGRAAPEALPGQLDEPVTMAVEPGKLRWIGERGGIPAEVVGTSGVRFVLAVDGDSERWVASRSLGNEGGGLGPAQARRESVQMA